MQTPLYYAYLKKSPQTFMLMKNEGGFCLKNYSKKNLLLVIKKYKKINRCSYGVNVMNNLLKINN